MKKALIIIAILAAVVSQAQQAVQSPVIWASDTTATTGRFVFEWKGDMHFAVRDSVRYEPEAPVFVPEYISLTESDMIVQVKKLRILNGDTSVRYHNLRIPLSEIQAQYNNFIGSVKVKNAIKRASKQLVKTKWNQE